MFKQTIEKIKNLQFGTLTLIFALYLLVNINLFFGDQSQEWERIIIIYLVMTAYLFAIPDLRSSLFEVNFWQKFPRYITSVIIGYITFVMLGIIFLGANITQYITTLSFGLIIAQSFVIAVCEESLFREYLENKLGRTISNILFGFFHFVVYGGNIIKTFFAITIGYILSKVKEWQNKTGNQNGLITIIALHAGANLAQK